MRSLRLSGGHTLIDKYVRKLGPILQFKRLLNTCGKRVKDHEHSMNEVTQLKTTWNLNPESEE